MAFTQPKFDLDKLFNLKYGYEPLKELLEYLLKKDKVYGDKISENETNIEKTDKELKQIKIPKMPPPQDNSALKEKLLKLEERVYSHDEKLGEHQAALDATSFNLRMTQVTVNQHEEKLNELSSLKEALDALTTRVEALEALMAAIQKKLAERPPTVQESVTIDSGLGDRFEDLVQRVETLEKDSNELKNGQQLLKEGLSDISQKTQINTDDIDMLKKKMPLKSDKDEFDKLVIIVNELKGRKAVTEKIIVEKGNTVVQGPSSDIGERLTALESEIKLLKEQVSGKAENADLENLKKEVEMLKQGLEETKTSLEENVKLTEEHTAEIDKIKTRLDLLELKLSGIQKTLTDLQSKLEKLLARSHEQAPAGGYRLEESDWLELKQAVDGIKRDMSDIQKEFSLLRELQKRVKQLEILMDTKLDKDEFEKYKQSLDLDRLFRGLEKKFMDRNDIIRSLKKLEKRIMMLEELMSKETIGEAENALLAKKPLGGWSCASCQKDLINLEGQRVSYYPWARLPTRGPSERIAKVGHGFSRMLSMLKPDLIAKSQQIGIKKGYAEEDMLSGEDDDKIRMAKTHGAAFLQSDMKRPNTAHMLPNLSPDKKQEYAYV